MKQTNREQRQRGFTLIELVVVIAILAILAAFALPRFAQLSEQAHVASVKGTSGALSAGVALVKAQWTVNGLTTAVTAVEGFGNDDVAATDDGWPDPVVSGGCAELWTRLLQSNAPTIATSGDTTEYTSGFASPVCTYTYNPNGENYNITYNFSSGEVAVNF